MLQLFSNPIRLLLLIDLSLRHKLIDELGRLLHVPLALVLQLFQVTFENVDFVHGTLCIRVRALRQFFESCKVSRTSLVFELVYGKLDLRRRILL